MQFHPLKAPSVSVHNKPGIYNLPYPLWATPKIDGWRCSIVQGVALTASGQAIPNAYVSACLRGLPELDGELVVPGGFQAVHSAFSSREGIPKFTYNVFDTFTDPDFNYESRLAHLQTLVPALQQRSYIRILWPVKINTPEELLDYERKCLDLGFEGVMLRYPNSPYKFGRSTAREGYLLKLKRFVDSEGTVIGFKELVHDATTLSRQLTLGTMDEYVCEHSSRLGALILRDIHTGIEFSVGSGFSHEVSADIWANREKYFGKIAVYKYLPHGMKTAPRHPVFKGWRSEKDMTRY